MICKWQKYANEHPRVVPSGVLKGYIVYTYTQNTWASLAMTTMVVCNFSMAQLHPKAAVTYTVIPQCPWRYLGTKSSRLQISFHPSYSHGKRESMGIIKELIQNYVGLQKYNLSYTYLVMKKITACQACAATIIKFKMF